MESTREQVLKLVQASGGTTLAALSKALGLGQASLRRHLDHLRAEGLVDVRAERHGVGRPAFVFFPTEEAEERKPAYSRLLSRIYRGLAALDEGELRGRDGTDVLGKVFEGAAGDVAREHKAEVAARSLEGRVAETSKALAPEGIVDGWTRDRDGLRLSNSACPYRGVALAGPGCCELDRRTIELLVDAPVRQVSRIADGEATCEYIVDASAEGARERTSSEERR